MTGNLTYICIYLQYNSKDSSVRLVYEPQPRPRAIAALAGETVVKVACGTNHTGGCYSFLDLGYDLIYYFSFNDFLFWIFSGGG